MREDVSPKIFLPYFQTVFISGHLLISEEADPYTSRFDFTSDFTVRRIQTQLSYLFMIINALFDDNVMQTKLNSSYFRILAVLI